MGTSSTPDGARECTLRGLLSSAAAHIIIVIVIISAIAIHISAIAIAIDTITTAPVHRDSLLY